MSRITLHRPRLTTLPSKLIAAGAALAGAGLAIALAGSLASGGPPVPASTPAPAAAPAGDVTAAPEIEPAPAAPRAPLPDLKLGEPTVAFMVDQPVQVQVTRVTAPPPDPDWPASSPDCRIVLAEVRVTNQGSRPVDLSSESGAIGVQMQYGPDAQETEPAMSRAEAMIDTHRLQPGKTARGTYAFEIPEDAADVLVAVNATSGQTTPDDLDDDIPATMVWTGKVS
jgi:hypothetical protein